ncbi:rRNA maturation endonuclease Nob1 [Paenibacillus phyllosphaerae]|uniref:rRNA maturation endonuclease Nob1 n=1 Tax=Paenibacillus phyllosphaerae TaxID=274593 RepID=A0A7W5AU38_9BACL|nr:hypothetical protein [Paenibacillus phyllosphaerae]MBB3108594.1 rRNA maturation endonuclease Nob1 [Paenibacillus phyllosphaerae]
MSFFDKVKQGASEAAKKAQQSAAEAARKAQQAMEVTKLRGQIAGKEKDQEHIFRQIGEAVYRNHTIAASESADPAAEVDGYLRQLDEIQMEIEMIEERIKHIRADRSCGNCGKAVPFEANFCPDCGAPVAQLEPRVVVEDELEESDEIPLALEEPKPAPVPAMSDGEIRVICSRCLHENELTAKNCVVCGTSLTGAHNHT